MKRWILLIGLMTGVFTHAESLDHTFKDGETLWFLAQVYYGKGEDYTRIIEANQLKSADRVRDGQKLTIPSPLFKPTQPGFDLRVTHLRGKRAEALAKRLVASVPTSETPGKKIASAASEPPVAKIAPKASAHEEPAPPAPKSKKEKEELSPLEKAKRELGGR